MVASDIRTLQLRLVVNSTVRTVPSLSRTLKNGSLGKASTPYTTN